MVTHPQQNKCRRGDFRDVHCRGLCLLFPVIRTQHKLTIYDCFGAHETYVMVLLYTPAGETAEFSALSESHCSKVFSLVVRLDGSGPNPSTFPTFTFS